MIGLHKSPTALYYKYMYFLAPTIQSPFVACLRLRHIILRDIVRMHAPYGYYFHARFSEHKHKRERTCISASFIIPCQPIQDMYRVSHLVADLGWLD